MPLNNPTVSLKQITDLVPSLDADGKLILTDSTQIGTKTADLAELWTKGTKIAIGDTTGIAEINGGSYAGDSSANKAIAHGLAVTPKLVIIVEDTTGNTYTLGIRAGYVHKIALSTFYSVTAMSATNFYVGNATSYPNSANDTGPTYYWVAVG